MIPWEIYVNNRKCSVFYDLVINMILLFYSFGEIFLWCYSRKPTRRHEGYNQANQESLFFVRRKKIMLEFLENCCDSDVMPKFLKQPKSKQGQSSQQLKNLVRHAMKENIWRRYWTIIILWRSNGFIERINKQFGK